MQSPGFSIKCVEAEGLPPCSVGAARFPVRAEDRPTHEWRVASVASTAAGNVEVHSAAGPILGERNGNCRLAHRASSRPYVSQRGMPSNQFNQVVPFSLENPVGVEHFHAIRPSS